MEKVKLILLKKALGKVITVRDGFLFFKYDGVLLFHEGGKHKKSYLNPMVKVSVKDAVAVVDRYGVTEEGEYEMLQLIKFINREKFDQTN